VRSYSFTSPKYLNDLNLYLDEKNVHLLDLGDDPRFTSDLFRDPIHLNEQGMELFTKLVAEELLRISAE